jgi:uncharacterized circularly permuted ATP-grasp superfamily protein
MSTALVAPAGPAVGARPYNEMRVGDGLSPAYAEIDRWLRGEDISSLEACRAESSELFRRRGITFVVYGDAAGARRLIPFDIIPRVIRESEWRVVESGCVQRVKALNAFLCDIYDGREIVRAGIIPEHEVLGNKLYAPVAQGVRLPWGVHAHVAGIDVVRVSADNWYVLEDNLRTPSGVSYMLENRAATRRILPRLFERERVLPIEHYPQLLLESLRACAPAGVDDPTVVVLTPGAANSAYFEHAFLAQRMGAVLAEGRDLHVDRGQVWLSEIGGPRQVDVIYRRIDDEFLDPTAFRPDSLLGVPGLAEVWRSGRVSLANAIGNGVADDKSTYLRVPDMIRFYLGEEPILANVPTWRLSDREDRLFALERMHELVFKEVHGSGGYGMLVGPVATASERSRYRARILADPSSFIAQPTLALSTCPTYVDQGIAPRHVDLRPYVVSGRDVALVPGGLTRVALKEGSLIVNSSQGGGTKDTWVIRED